MDFSGLADALSGRPLTAIPLLFLGGLLTSLTPCVYPMIPITVALVGQESLGTRAGSKWRPLFLTLSYVVGVAVVYAILGVIAGMSGSIFGSISSNQWLYFLHANVFLLAGLFMLAVFTLCTLLALISHVPGIAQSPVPRRLGSPVAELPEAFSSVSFGLSSIAWRWNRSSKA